MMVDDRRVGECRWQLSDGENGKVTWSEREGYATKMGAELEKMRLLTFRS
jgi:hypothetical protein